MSRYGIKIKNIKAGALYEANLGVRDYFTYTDAMLNNSLFSDYLQRNGMNIYKNESTRDIICLDYDFGSRSYKDEIKRLNQLLEKSDITEEYRERLLLAVDKVESQKHLYSAKKKDEIREYFYENGVDVVYKTKNKDGSFSGEKTIHYVMLFRTTAKAKLGQVMFINSKLYDKAYDWLTIGLGNKMDMDNAKIVEMSAYAPLTTSTIVGKIHISVEDILILEDKDYFFKTIANVIRDEEYVSKNKDINKKCIVTQEETEVKNTIWDGMALIESSILPDWINGMALLRNHLFKSCAFRGNLQLFFKDWCELNGYDYDIHKVQDMFGKWHYLKNIKMITTDNSIKWKKFEDLMGSNLTEAYEYWCDRIHDDGDIWGIVKTDHQSKLGQYQQLSYQMINTLPCTKDDVRDIASTSVNYVELLKRDNNEFEKFLRSNANEINHYEMLADLYSQNHKFGNSTFFREEKKKIIFSHVYRLRKGKIVVNGDNLTVCGNPYALLLYSVGDDWTKDDTFSQEYGSVQCYTQRFDDDEYLCAFRSPHNSPNNICYLHNVKNDKMIKYFDFSENIIAVNCIGTDIQDRSNGCDFDSDFFLVTNQPTMVKYAKICYDRFPTIVNAIRDKGLVYQNTNLAYAKMDNKFSESGREIGESSNLAQLAMTYYWTEIQKENPDKEKLKELYDNFVTLSVVAQIVIDSCKREYDIVGKKEIDRIRRMDCMNITTPYTSKDNETKQIKNDFPEFMRYVKEIKYTKDGKELPSEEVQESKDKLKKRINKDLCCPMNWLEEIIDGIEPISSTSTIPTSEFFIKMKGKPNNRQMNKIREVVEEYDGFIKSSHATNVNNDDDFVANMINKSNIFMDELSKIKIGNIVTINRLIETALGMESGVGLSKNTRGMNIKYTRKILNLLYKTNKDKFLINFACDNS